MVEIHCELCCILESYFYIVYPVFLPSFSVVYWMRRYSVVSISHLAQQLSEENENVENNWEWCFIIEHLFTYLIAIEVLLLLKKAHCFLMNIMQKIEHVLHHYYCGRWCKYLCKWIAIYDIQLLSASWLLESHFRKHLPTVCIIYVTTYGMQQQRKIWQQYSSTSLRNRNDEIRVTCIFQNKL